MKCYHFQNYYLASTQAGIQTAHSQHTFTKKYFIEGADKDNSEALEKLKDWIVNHQTIILLNGGGHKNLVDLEKFLFEKGSSYPWVSFDESYETVNCAKTNVGIVLPENIYNNRHLGRALSEFIDIDGNKKDNPIDSTMIDNKKTFVKINYEKEIITLSIPGSDDISYTFFEAAILQRIAFARLM